MHRKEVPLKKFKSWAEIVNILIICVNFYFPIVIDQHLMILTLGLLERLKYHVLHVCTANGKKVSLPWVLFNFPKSIKNIKFTCSVRDKRENNKTTKDKRYFCRSRENKSDALTLRTVKRGNYCLSSPLFQVSSDNLILSFSLSGLSRWDVKDFESLITPILIMQTANVWGVWWCKLYVGIFFG